MACLKAMMILGLIQTKGQAEKTKKTNTHNRGSKKPIKVKSDVLNTSKFVEGKDMTEWLCPLPFQHAFIGNGFCLLIKFSNELQLPILCFGSRIAYTFQMLI